MKSLHSFMVSCLLWLIVSLSAMAAEHKTQTASSPAEILINNALMTNVAGMQHYVKIRLIATDRLSLRRHQVYQAVFDAAMGGVSDASYNEAEGVIFINTLSQAGALIHQMTLKRVGFNQFAVIEYITSVVVYPDGRPSPRRTYDAVPPPPKLHDGGYSQ